VACVHRRGAFSHYSIQEFLVVHTLETDTARFPPDPLRVTAEMLEFLTFSSRMPDFGRLDLAGLQPYVLAGFGFQDQLQDGSPGPRMQLIPPGEYLIGSRDDGPFAKANEQPRRSVTITQAFALGRYPVTFEEYDRFAAATGRERPDDAGWDRGRRPVINVSLQDAVAYCDWLSEQTGCRYRLPTEAEWEYAARAGTDTRWFHGNDPAQCDTYGWYRENTEGRTHPVGEKQANPWGLYDMLGNVDEWCLSGRRNRAQATQTRVDPSTQVDLSDSVPVVRGGSWRDTVESCRPASRMEIPFEDLRDLLLLDHDLRNRLDRDPSSLRDHLDRVLLNRSGFRCVRVQAILEQNHPKPDT